MNLHLKTPQNPNETPIPEMVRNLTDCYMVMHKQILNLLDGMLDTNNVREIKADKISAGVIRAAIEMISPLITGGTITGGTVRTAEKGERMEITKNLLKIYNKNGNLNGMNISENDATYGDLSFYIDGNLALEMFSNISGYSLKPYPGYQLVIGSNGESTYLENVADAKVNIASLKEQSISPDVGEGYAKLYYDGTDLKVKFPDGTVKTVTLT